MSTASPTRAAAAGAIALSVLLAASASAPAATSKAPSAATALSTLVRQTTALPRGGVPATKRTLLLRRARHARSSARLRPCVAVRDLNSYRRSLKTTKPRPAQRATTRDAVRRRLANLGTSSLTASRRLLAAKRTKACGGGVAASTATHTTTSVNRSDVNGMTIGVTLPALRFVPQTGGGQAWTKLLLPDTDSPGAPGTPGIPEATSLIAVPDGATLDVKATKTTSYTLDGVEVYPVQPDTADQGQPGLAPKPDFLAGPFSDTSFTMSRTAYASDALVPAAPAFGTSLGQARDLNIAGLHFPAAQYNPKTDKLEVITHVDVQVTFAGGTKDVSNALGSPWETAQNRLAGGLLNANIVRQFDPPIIYQPCGEELLVITNPSTLASANTYATARRAAGFLTRVVQTGAAAGQIGTTAPQIQTYIRSQVNHPFCIRPSYATIIGDDELVPTFTTGPGGIPSDNPYSTKNDADELPDLAVGRMLGNTSAQLDAAIAKIIHYETSPPTGPMLNKAIVAAQFQDVDDVGEVNDGQEDRTFLQFAETVRNGLTARGVAVDRIYEDNPTTTPVKFNDGTPLPAALLKPTFAWDGDGADVTAAWNQGRFMVVHRDHGWSDGWGDPFFTTTEVDALTNSNDNLPVVLSINCASAQYDTDETSFVQNALDKTTGGAVGVFGDTRNSPSWHNSQLALGFVDALLPSVLSGEGPSSKQRMGDALVHGKLRLAGLAPPSGPGIAGGSGDTRNELYLWHYFGDPTMQMFGGGSAPLVFNPASFNAIYRELPIPRPGDPPPFEVNVTFPSNPALTGQPISLLRNGEVIGKAIAGDGSVEIPATFNDGVPRPGELTVALEADGAAPVSFGVDGVPAPPPVEPPPAVATTLTQTCPSPQTFSAVAPTTVSISGNLAGAPAGSTVSVTFTRPTRFIGNFPQTPTETVDVTTGPQGEWTASATPTTDRSDLGTWTVSSSYAGVDKQFLPSQGGPCSVVVQLLPA
jgi:hypothetical protein